VYRNRWEDAAGRLHATNNFPEFTGRLCPAPCEEACVLGINEPPVTIEQIEKEIAERAWREGWVRPQPPAQRTGRKIAIVGSGPAGLACAQQLNRAGHTVTVFERDDRIGGLLRYGIPDFKMEKQVIDRRLQVMEAEGISFKTGIWIGKTVHADQLKKDYDAIVLACGATKPRDLQIPGRNLNGVHFAMEFLPQQNRVVAGDKVPGQITARGKRVIVIGGGDTGSDCIGTSNRQGAVSVTNFELLPMPPKERPAHQPWPYYPMKLRTSTSHEEGCERFWSILTKQFKGDAYGNVESLVTVDIRWDKDAQGRNIFHEIEGSERIWPCQLVLLAMGFVGPEKPGTIEQLGIELDPRGNVKCDANYMTNVEGVFAAGDMRRGQSLVVWAIHEGREAARAVDKHLMGVTNLPSVNAGDFAWR
jgi:glutamate synthase (NADPH/NADH) small chain